MKYRVGIVGCGGIARVHAQSLLRMDNVEMAAFADCKLERAQSFASEYGGSAYASLEEMLAAEHLDAARKKLCDLLCNYQGYRKCRVILVFDAYKVKGGLGSVEKYHNITIVYTKEAETADAYIERATYEIGRQHRVRVATSDGLEQMIILGHGALRLSARAFKAEVEQVEGQISAVLDKLNRREKSGAVEAAMDRARDRKKE